MEIVNVDKLYAEGKYMALHEALEKYIEVLQIEEEREMIVTAIKVGDQEVILLTHRDEVETDVEVLRRTRGIS